MIWLFLFLSFCEINAQHQPSLDQCVQQHRQDGQDYVWLWPEYGRLLAVEYEEPPSNGQNFRPYTLETWQAHCRVVSHIPLHLKDAHVYAFINPQTRFARLRFTFQRRDNTIYVREPDPHFYELEAAYFAKL